MDFFNVIKMDSSQTSTNAPTFMQRVSAASEKAYDEYGAEKELTKARDFARSSWTSPLVVLIVAVIVMIIVAFLIYNSYASLFTGTGALAGLSAVVTAGGGLLFLTLIVLFGAAMAACLGLAFKENMVSFGVTAVAALLIGLLFYFMMGAANQNKKTLFLVWAIIGILLGVVAGLYGYWSLYNMAKSAGGGDLAIEKSRKMYSLIFLIVGVIVAIVLIYALYLIYGVLTG